MIADIHVIMKEEEAAAIVVEWVSQVLTDKAEEAAAAELKVSIRVQDMKAAVRVTNIVTTTTMTTNGSSK
jgi:hypothetical protein